jgi:hypothetical protein
VLRGPGHSNRLSLPNQLKTEHYNKNSVVFPYLCETCAYLCSARELTFASIFLMPIRITSCKCTPVLRERNFHLFCFLREKACSHVYAIPNTQILYTYLEKFYIQSPLPAFFDKTLYKVFLFIYLSIFNYRQPELTNIGKAYSLLTLRTHTPETRTSINFQKDDFFVWQGTVAILSKSKLKSIQSLQQRTLEEPEHLLQSAGNFTTAYTQFCNKHNINILLMGDDRYTWGTRYNSNFESVELTRFLRH